MADMFEKVRAVQVFDCQTDGGWESQDWSTFPGVRPSHSSRCLFLSFRLPLRSSARLLDSFRNELWKQKLFCTNPDGPTPVCWCDAKRLPALQSSLKSAIMAHRSSLPLTPTAAQSVPTWHLLLHRSQIRFFLSLIISRRVTQVTFSYCRSGSHG